MTILIDRIWSNNCILYFKKRKSENEDELQKIMEAANR